MRPREFIIGEEDGIRNAVAAWWIDRGEEAMAERVGRLFRTPGVSELYEKLNSEGKADRFAAACSNSFQVDEDVATIVRVIFQGFSIGVA